MQELLWLLLPVAAASGWWWSQHTRSKQSDYRRSNSSDYFKGLNYLLDDKQDQAIEVFVRVAETERDTMEAHLTLGNLFRRRGEVDRAINIHHNLIQRQNLSTAQRQQATLELAEDYMKAGLFDRAETLYHSIIQQTERTEQTAIALNRLIQIYEQEKDWGQALKHCDLLEQMTGQVRKIAAAHYCCELAENAAREGQKNVAEEHLRTALKRDSNCARANLLSGKIAIEAGRYDDAMQALLSVPKQQPALLIEIVTPLEQCYQAQSKTNELIDYLSDLHKQHRTGRLTAAIADLIAHHQGVDAALSFLETEMNKEPSFIGLRRLVEIKLERDSGNVNSDLQALYLTSRDMLDNAARYRCDYCGFTVRNLNWHCPSCKQWNSVKPLGDLICRNNA